MCWPYRSKQKRALLGGQKTTENLHRIYDASGGWEIITENNNNNNNIIEEEEDKNFIGIPNALVNTASEEYVNAVINANFFDLNGNPVGEGK